MLIAGWSFTNICNLRCKHCYNNSGKKKDDEITTKEALKICDKLKESKVTAINFGGGECPLRNDFIHICEYLKNNLGMKISLTTNGTTYELIKSHINLFHDIGVSIDFSDEKKHDWFRGVNGTYSKALNTLKSLSSNGVETEIVTCLTKLNANIPELRRIYNLAKEVEVGSWRINRYRPIGRVEMINKLKLDKRLLKKCFNYFSSVSNFHSQSDPLFRSVVGGRGGFEGCPCGSHSFRIQPNGEVSPCIYLKESGGNIRYNSLTKIIQSDIFNAMRNRKPKGKCIKCNAYEHCKGGCAGASFIENGCFDAPDPLCWLKPEESKCNVEISIPKIWNVHELYLGTIYIPIKGR